MGKSPAELMMGRKLRRSPNTKQGVDVVIKMEMKRKQKEQYNQTAKELPPLNSDEVVQVREQQ